MKIVVIPFDRHQMEKKRTAPESMAIVNRQRFSVIVIPGTGKEFMTGPAVPFHAAPW
jgi:hypothetical protein